MPHLTAEIKERIRAKGLRVTPQRMAILEAVYRLNNHPTAEQIIECIRNDNSAIAIGTVYLTLDTFVEHQLLRRVKTDRDIMRYDGIMEHHHHLYCSECDLIEDYQDQELDALLEAYFEKKQISGFHLQDIVLQLRGTFNKC